MPKDLVPDATAGMDPHNVMDDIDFDELYAGMVNYCEGTQFDGPLPVDPADPDPIPEDDSGAVDTSIKKMQTPKFQV